MALGTLADYLAGNQGLSAASAAASDVAGSSALSSLLGSFNPYTVAASGILDLVGLLGGPNLDPVSAIMSAFQGRPTMQATQDIASNANNQDPVIALLGQGAQELASKGTPISSSKASDTSSFGPWFQVASDIENLARWGTTDPTAQQKALTATTLKNALTELGNPGQGTQTIQALEQTWARAAQSFTPQQIQQLYGEMSPTEEGIFKQTIQQYNPTLANQAWPDQQTTTPGFTPGSTTPPAQTYPNPEPALASQEGQYVKQYQDYENQYKAIQGQPGAPTPPPPPAPPGANATAQDEANYIQQYQNYEKAYQNFQNQYGNYVNSQPQPSQSAQSGPQYGNYGGPQPGIYPSGGGQQQFGGPQFSNYQKGQQPIQGQQGNRPSNCPPCPPSGSQGGNTNTGTGNTTTGTGNTLNIPPNQNLLQQLLQLMSQQGNQTTNPPGTQPGNQSNPSTGNNWLNILNQLFNPTTGTTTTPGSTNVGGPTPAPAPATSNPLQTLQNMVQQGALGALFGSPGGFSYGWTKI